MSRLSAFAVKILGFIDPRAAEALAGNAHKGTERPLTRLARVLRRLG